MQTIYYRGIYPSLSFFKNIAMVHSTILSLNVFPDLILKQKSWSELMQWFYKSKHPYSISLILASRPNLKQTHGLNYSIVNMQVKQWSEECFRKFIIVNVLKNSSEVIYNQYFYLIGWFCHLEGSKNAVQKYWKGINFDDGAFHRHFYLFSVNFCPIFDF